MRDSAGLVSGRFRLGELLGTGGSASVFAAVDARTGSPLALKILHPHLAQRLAARDAFLAEARRAQPLRHPNIVGVLGVGVDDSADAPLAWIALERAGGASLSEHVAQNGPLTPAEAVAVTEGILRALEAAHAIGLIHRDVSPSNVMVAPSSPGSALESEGVRLLDFGLADAAGKAALGSDDLLSLEATGRSGVIGNVNYMSPEQAQGSAVDARGDVYQVGAVLHFALTGRPPFPRETTGQTMRAHLETPPPVPSVTDPRIPRALDRIVVRAMLKAPADRFESAADMRAALTRVAIAATRSGMRAATPAVAAPAPATAVNNAAAADSADRSAAASGRPVGAEVPIDVTRVLGRTIVPPRDLGAAGLAAATAARHPPTAPARRARSRAGTWFAATTAAIVATIIVAAAATGTPTASVEAEPSASAPAVAPQTEPAPQPQPQLVETTVSLLLVPDLVNYTVGEAVRALVDAGLSAGEIRRIDSPLAGGTVLESSPTAGQSLGAGGTVALIVASGFHAIPDVAGQGRDAAAAMVQSAGFAPSFAYRAAPAGTPSGAILGTDPQPGTVLAVGTSITILEAVASAPTPTPMPSAPTPTATPAPTATPTAAPGG